MQVAHVKMFGMHIQLEFIKEYELLSLLISLLIFSLIKFSWK